MSLPPQVIKVKRKRTEEGPVPSFLRIENDTKRHRSDAFLYRRHNPVEAAAKAEQAAALAARPPTIHSSRPGDKKRNSTAEAGVKDAPPAEAGKTPAPAPAAQAPIVPAEPRRFHLSRASIMGSGGGGSGGVSGFGSGIRKKVRYGPNGVIASETAVFIERSKKRHRGDVARKERRSRHKEAAVADSVVPKTVITEPTTATTTTTTTTPHRPLPKRPSWRGPLRSAARESSGTSTPDTATPTTTTVTATPTGTSLQLPASLVNRQWDTDMDKLAREMDQYTLEVIGRNLAQMEQQDARAAEARRQAAQDAKAASDADMAKAAAEKRRAAFAKYRPTSGLRHAEQRGLAHGHTPDAGGKAAATAATAATSSRPGSAGSSHGEPAADMAASDSDASSETDEDDYVTETYVRVPGHEARKAAQAAPEQVGLLIFDNQPDIEYFYGAEEDSEEEFDDDEDENAENYYTHDYPEDEVESDDEFGREAYNYRTGNASDMEEFLSDEEFSGDDEADGDVLGHHLRDAHLKRARGGH